MRKNRFLPHKFKFERNSGGVGPYREKCFLGKMGVGGASSRGRGKTGSTDEETLHGELTKMKQGGRGFACIKRRKTSNRLSPDHCHLLGKKKESHKGPKGERFGGEADHSCQDFKTPPEVE